MGEMKAKRQVEAILGYSLVDEVWENLRARYGEDDFLEPEEYEEGLVEYCVDTLRAVEAQLRMEHRPPRKAPKQGGQRGP